MTHYLDAAVKAACAAGEMLRHNFEKPMQVNQSTKHDIKLEIDVRAQELIAQKGATPKLNDREFRVSERADLAEAIVSVGLSKTGITIEAGIPLLQTMVHRARKCRLLGSAALDMAYVACGRFDAYIEQGISLWDVAAGWILVETAGGSVEMKPRTDMPDRYSIIASNGVVDLKL